MAETKNVTYASIMRDLKARKFAPVYYLYGEESYYIDKISDYIAENVLRNEYPSESIFWLFGMSSGLPKDSPSSMRMPSAVRAVESITSGNRRWSSEVLPASMKFAMPSAPDRNGTFTLSRDSPRIAASGICAEIDTSSGGFRT